MVATDSARPRQSACRTGNVHQGVSHNQMGLPPQSTAYMQQWAASSARVTATASVQPSATGLMLRGLHQSHPPTLLRQSGARLQQHRSCQSRCRQSLPGRQSGRRLVVRPSASAAAAADLLSGEAHVFGSGYESSGEEYEVSFSTYDNLKIPELSLHGHRILCATQLPLETNARQNSPA